MAMSNESLCDLPGLGPKSESWLLEVGIDSPQKLRDLGPIQAFIKVRKVSGIKPGLNFLYALVGALEGEHWLTIAKKEKARILMALNDYEELEKIMQIENAE